jgi:dolichol-phosphate mannosyltransferase
MSNKVVSLVIPVYNEQDNLEWHHNKIKKFTSTIKDYDFKILYVDDGSTDSSIEVIQRLCRKDKSSNYISFSRNFGKEPAVTAGLQYAQGDAAIVLDADGQHPIELITKFLNQWEAGSEVVIGVRSSNTKEGFVKKYGSKLFYWMLAGLTSEETIPAATDFRLIDRKVIDEFSRLTEHNRISRGLIDWLGFKRSYVEFKAKERHAGKATYNYSKLMSLAFHAFVAQSTKPLKFVGVLGFIISAVSSVLGLVLIVEKWIGDPWGLAVSGTALLAVFLSFLVGIVLICQGLLALYIESIYSESRNRPLYIIRETDN